MSPWTSALEEALTTKAEKLSKVILQLNERSEDFEIETLEEKSEIEVILRQTVNSINAFKTQVEDARDDTAIKQVQQSCAEAQESMKLVHKEEKKSLLKTIQDLEHVVSTKDQEISSLQGAAARLEVYFSQKEIAYQDQINENQINLVEQRQIAEAKYQTLEQEKKQMESKIIQITKEHKISVQNYQNQIKSLKNKLIKHSETFDRHLSNTSSQTMLQIEAVKEMNNHITTTIDTIKAQVEHGKLSILHHFQNHLKLIETHSRTTAALMELEECLTENSAQLEKQIAEAKIMKMEHSEEQAHIKQERHEQVEELNKVIVELQGTITELETTNKQHVATNESLQGLKDDLTQMLESSNKHTADLEAVVWKQEMTMKNKMAVMESLESEVKRLEMNSRAQEAESTKYSEIMEQKLKQEKESTNKLKSKIEAMHEKFNNEKEALLQLNSEEKAKLEVRQQQWNNERTTIAKMLEDRIKKQEESFENQMLNIEKSHDQFQANIKQDIESSMIEFEKKRFLYETKIDDFHERTNSINKQLTELKTSYKLKITQNNLKLKQENEIVERLTLEKVQLETALETMTTTKAQESQNWLQTKNQLNRTITETESKLKSVIEELNRTTLRSEQEKESLKNELLDKDNLISETINQLNKERTERRAKEDQLINTHHETIQLLKNEHQIQSTTLQGQIEHEKTNTINELVQSHRHQEEQLKLQLQSQFDAQLEEYNNSKSKEIEHLIEQKNNEVLICQTQMTEALTKQKLEIYQSTQNAQTQMEEIDRKHEIQIQQINDEWEDKIAIEKHSHSMDLTQMQTQYEKQLEAVREDHSRLMKDQEQQRQDEITKFKETQQHIIRSLTEQHTNTVTHMRASHMTEIHHLKEQQTKQEIKQNAKIEELESEFRKTIHTLDEEREQHASLKETHRVDVETREQTLDRLQIEATLRDQQHQSEYKQLEETQKSELARISNNHSEELEQAHSVFEERLSEKMEALTLIKQDYSRLKTRFEERESRTEDIHKIKLLETENLKCKQQLSELQETLDQVRRQMLLREENYNKHFRNGGAADRVLNVDDAKSSNTKISNWMTSRTNRRFNYLKKS